MSKTLTFDDSSPTSIKIGDTTTTFQVICGNDDVAVDLTDATSVVAKIGRNDEFVASQDIDITTIENPLMGEVPLPLSTSLSGKPAGEYQLEIWVTDPNGVSIYPSDAVLGFNLNTSFSG